VLGVDNLDVVVNETIPALRELQKQGLVRYVGVSGYPLNVRMIGLIEQLHSLT